ncbi:hypothetical protein [Geobacter argillaceus]|uniref:hypothetical protein n=1 Tax=Geobacter argillaceus TaxID=345631 RepID=UPI00119DBBCA|nr:hypothetical protein [Geobacter argillaceus]
MSRARWCRIAPLIILIPLLLAAGVVRPVRVSGDRGSSTIWLWAWQKGRIEFINSVTHLPVDISFGVPWRFSGFSVRTDPGTEEYYTAGGYSWNDQLAKEQPGTLSYCSEVGINVTLGEYLFHEQGGCINVSLVWPP